MTDTEAAIPMVEIAKDGSTVMTNLMIAMPDLTELVLPISRTTRATEVLEEIIISLNVDRRHARHALSLWIMSPDLELQLKPNHCPLQLLSKWPVYLRKYTEISEAEIYSQTPFFALRRNVFMSREFDLTITDSEILHLLFCEARLNILDSSYPVSTEIACNLAGILATMQYGPYKPEEHDHHFYKHSTGLVPTSLQEHTKLFSQSCDSILFEHKKSSSLTQAEPHSDASLADLAKAFLEQATEIPYYGSHLAELVPTDDIPRMKKEQISSIASYASVLEQTVDVRSQVKLCLAFLRESSQNIPYYGCVFFSGFIERSKKGRINFLQNPYLPVTIGLNPDGIYLIDAEHKKPLLGVLYPDLNWEFVNVCDCEKEACPHTNAHGRIQQHPKGQKAKNFDTTPSIILQYPTPGVLSDGTSDAHKAPSGDAERESASDGTSVIRVFTKSARMIDAFIENCGSSPSLSSPPLTPHDAVDGHPALDSIDGPSLRTAIPSSGINSHQRLSLKQSVSSITRPDKLVCIEFDKNGVCKE